MIMRSNAKRKLVCVGVMSMLELCVHGLLLEFFQRFRIFGGSLVAILYNYSMSIFGSSDTNALQVGNLAKYGVEEASSPLRAPARPLVLKIWFEQKFQPENLSSMQQQITRGVEWTLSSNQKLGFVNSLKI